MKKEFPFYERCKQIFTETDNDNDNNSSEQSTSQPTGTPVVIPASSSGVTTPPSTAEANVKETDASPAAARPSETASQNNPGISSVNTAIPDPVTAPQQQQQQTVQENPPRPSVSNFGQSQIPSTVSSHWRTEVNELMQQLLRQPVNIAPAPSTPEPRFFASTVASNKRRKTG